MTPLGVMIVRAVSVPRPPDEGAGPDLVPGLFRLNFPLRPSKTSFRVEALDDASRPAFTRLWRRARFRSRKGRSARRKLREFPMRLVVLIVGEPVDSFRILGWR